MPEIEVVFGSWIQFLAVAGVIVVAEAVYVLFGFGAGLIAVGSLAVLMPEIQDVVVLLLLINAPPELFVVSRSHRRVNWRGVLTICLGIAVGVPVGTWVLSNGEPTFILVLLGLFLVLAGGAFLLVPLRRGVRWPRWTAPPVGFVSGTLAGMFGTGGPPLIFYYQLGGMDKAAFRGNLMAIFLMVTLVRLPSCAAMGLITVPRLWSAAALLPAVLLGAWLGNRIHLQLSERAFRRLVSVALIVIGIVVLLSKTA